MTFTKTGSEWPDDLANAGLSDAAYRTHHEAVSWVYTVEQMGLRIAKPLVRRFAGSDQYEAAILELVAAGFWRDTGVDYELVHHADVIRGGIVAQRKKRERDKKAQQEARRRAASKAAVIADVSAFVSADPDRQTDNQHLLERKDPEDRTPYEVDVWGWSGSSGCAERKPDGRRCGVLVVADGFCEVHAAKRGVRP